MGFDPLTMGVMAIATTIGGGIVQAVGANQQAKAQSEMYQYQAAQARMNADINKKNAAYQRVVGDTQAQRLGIAQRQRMGAIRAAQGASGLRVGEGSLGDVIESQEMVDQSDQATSRANSARKAYAYEIGSVEELNKASMAEAASRNSEIAGGINVMGSILGTASSVSSKWLQGKQAGIFS